MTPIATIVVTAFDREASLARLLNGFNNQSVPSDSYEVILADDSGENRLGENIIRKVSTSYALSSVRTGLPYEVNGVSVARNMGIQNARGKIIISIDDDCFPSFFFVEEHIAAHNKNFPLIVLGHRSSDLSKLKEDRPVSVTEPKGINELVMGGDGRLNFSNFMTGNISLSKKVAMDSGLFNETFAQQGEHGYEDIELGYRLWRKGIPTVFSRNAMIYRPPTEAEKEQHRSATKAVEKASHRLLGLHPLLPVVKQFIDAVLNNRQEEAIGCGREILSTDQDHWPVLVHMGDLLCVRGEFEAAETHYSTALALYDRNPAIHTKYAELMFLQKRFKEAWDYSLKALTLSPNQTGALYLMAQLKPWVSKYSAHATQDMPEINIEMGGGTFPTKFRDEDHANYINLDVKKGPGVDVVADLSEPIEIPDGTISHIFSREMIEHLPYKKLPGFIQACYRLLKPGGDIYLSCPDFEAILDLYPRQCDCFKGQSANPACQDCKGKAMISSHYWRSNLLGDQCDYGDKGFNDTHKNQITYPLLANLLEGAGFVNIQRDTMSPYYESHKRIIKLSVTGQKP